MHIVIYFCGTGNIGTSFVRDYNYVENTNVKTIFVRGCEDPEVCNSIPFPNLIELDAII